MPIFISFEPRLLSQLSEKREKGEKTMRDVKQPVLIVGKTLVKPLREI